MTDRAFGDWDAATQEALSRWSSSVASGEGDSRARDHVRERLFGTLASAERFRPFFAELSHSFAMTIDAVAALLRKVDVPSSYQVAPIPGVQFFHFTPGEGCSFVEAGIVKLSKGSRFPRHRHLGQEMNFVLEGALIDNGISYGPGETVRNETGSEHDYLASEKRDLILVAGHNGITYLEG
jgi:quercetin dioxygenase-like cupin family protein